MTGGDEMTDTVRSINGVLMVGDRRATDDEWSVWQRTRIDARIAAENARDHAAGIDRRYGSGISWARPTADPVHPGADERHALLLASPARYDAAARPMTPATPPVRPARTESPALVARRAIALARLRRGVVAPVPVRRDAAAYVIPAGWLPVLAERSAPDDGLIAVAPAEPAESDAFGCLPIPFADASPSDRAADSYLRVNFGLMAPVRPVVTTPRRRRRPITGPRSASGSVPFGPVTRRLA